MRFAQWPQWSNTITNFEIATLITLVSIWNIISNNLLVASGPWQSQNSLNGHF